MEALPEWLGYLSSLQWLDLSKCMNLMYLPTAEAMQHLTYLNIEVCPKLKERCVKGSGAEWLKLPISQISISAENRLKGSCAYWSKTDQSGKFSHI